MGPVRIRPAIPGDAGPITRVYMESAEHHAQLDPVSCNLPDRAAIEERYRQGRQHPESEFPAVTLVAEAGGEIVGFLDAQIQLPFDPMLRPIPYCFIADVAVAAARRSEGIGAKLIQAIESWARYQGAGFVSLIYNAGNPRVAELYTKLGYRVASVGMTKRL
jgi:GNAT superfamily N-acetyltransferase